MCVCVRARTPWKGQRPTAIIIPTGSSPYFSVILTDGEAGISPQVGGNGIVQIKSALERTIDQRMQLHLLVVRQQHIRHVIRGFDDRERERERGRERER